MALQGLIGPIVVSGTLTAEDRQEIWEKTKCSASVRGRANRDRSLTVSGPVAKLEEAHNLAMAAMENNKQKLVSGGSWPSAGGEFKGTDEREAAGKTRRVAFMDPKGTQDHEPEPPSQGLPGSEQKWKWAPWQAWAWNPGWWTSGPSTPVPSQGLPGSSDGSAPKGSAPTGSCSKPAPAEKATSSSSSGFSSSPSTAASMPCSVDYGGSDAESQEHTHKKRKEQPQEGKQAKEQPQAKKKAQPKQQPQPEKKEQPQQGKKAKEQPQEKEQPEAIFLMPRCLRGLEFRVYTVGCKGDICLEQELHDAGVSLKQSLLLDCRNFQGARSGVEWHWGASTTVLVNIMRADKDSLRIVFDQVAKNLTKKDISNLAFYCDHGKHRSVGVATLTSMAMKMASNGWRILDIVPLMKKYWSRKKCPWIHCPECLEQNDTKHKCYKEALQMFTQEWQKHEGL